jgi:hypothetical protein
MRDGPVEDVATAAAETARMGPGSRGLGVAARDELQRAVGERYRLDHELGAGGFGLVWQAHDLARGQTCSIKFLRRERAHGFSLIRFKREYRTARRLHHPRCVRVFDLNQANGLWFFSMEHVAGTTLREARHLRGNVRDITAIGLQILAALDEVHRQAIVHRDIKPHNILIAPGDTSAAYPIAKLTDFGIAKVGDLDDGETVCSLRGSLPYMAPELVTEGVADARCDLYGLGVTLYQALCGRHPLGEGGSAADWLARIRRTEPIALASVLPDLPSPVANAIMRLCARDAAARYCSAAQAFDELAGWFAGQAGYPMPELPPLTRGPYLAAPRLIGRDAERTCIDRFLAANLGASAQPRSAPPLLLLSGPAGVGKSRLLSWLLRNAEQYEPQLLLGHTRSEIGAPFEAVQPILKALGDTTIRGDATETSDADRAVSTTTLVAAHGGATPAASELGTDHATSSTSARSRRDAAGLRPLLHLLTDRLLDAVEGQPTVVVIEDVQWSDVETLELLKLWTRTLAVDRADGRDLPVALVATYRPVAADTPLASLARELQHEGRALAVDLAVPGPAAAVELAAEFLMSSVDEPLARACQQLFGGQPATPLYVGQVLRLLLSRGLLTRADQHHWDGLWDFSQLTGDIGRLIPATVEQAIGERAARLSIDTKSLLSAAAVIGRRFAPAPVSRAAGLDAPLARDCLEEAARAGFVAESPDQDDAFVFVHDRVREALYSALSAEQRQHLHRAAAAALLDLSPHKGRDVAADLAHHFHRAGDHRHAYRFSALAGQLALRALQFSRASDLLAQAVDHAEAVDIPVPLRLLCRLGDAAALALHIERAETAYQRALARTGHRDRRLRLLTRMGELYDRAHNAQAALDCYAQALAHGLPWYLRGPVVPWLLVLAAISLAIALPPAVVVGFCRSLLAGHQRTRLEAVWRCAHAACTRAFVHGRIGAGLRFGVFMIAAGFAGKPRARGAPFGVATAALQVATAILGLERKADRWAELGAGVATNSWPDRDRFVYHLMRGSAALFLAREAAAVHELRQAFALAKRRKDPLLMESAGTALVGAYRLFARTDEALTLIHTLGRFAKAEELSSVVPMVLFYEAATHVNRFDYQSARTRLAELRAQPDAIDRKDILTTHLVDYFELRCAARLDEPSEALARQLIELLESAERCPPTVPVVSLPAAAFVIAVEVCAQLAREGTLPRDLAQSLARSRRRLRPVDGRGRWRGPFWLAAYALYDAMQGNTRRAQQELERGLDLLARCGADNYRALVCSVGQRAFAPGSALANRCAEELRQLVERRPGLRDGLQSDRS